jgi:hypothetical protein
MDTGTCIHICVCGSTFDLSQKSENQYSLCFLEPIINKDLETEQYLEPSQKYIMQNIFLHQNISI